MTLEFDHLLEVKNEKHKRFEFAIDGKTVFIDYVERPNEIALIHTESTQELMKRGAVSALIEKTLTYIKKHNYQLIPLCPHVFNYILRHPKWIKIVKKELLNRFNK